MCAIDASRAGHFQLIEAELRGYVSLNETAIDSDNTLSTDRDQAVGWNNNDL